MARLKVPSLQHLARIWRDDPVSIKKVLVRLSTNGPTFSYAPLFKIVSEMLLFGTRYDRVLENVQRIGRADVRGNFLGLMPLIRDHFDGIKTDFVHEVAPRLYSVDRSLQIPFTPPLIYGSGGKIYFPWLSFWKSNPLHGESLSLFVTIVEEILLQDSDLEEAKFEILDFSAEDSKSPRSLKVLNAQDIPRLSSDRKVEMLATFAEGFRLAKAELNQRQSSESEIGVEDRKADQAQLDLL